MESTVPESIIHPISNWLDDDLIAEILKRLPVKSLCRFRCVSKSFNSLISSPSFVSLHYSTSSSIPANLKPYLRRRPTDFEDSYALCHPQDEHIRHQLHFPFRFRYDRSSFMNKFDFIDLIKGLVCLFNPITHCSHSMIIWNPAIHKYLITPVQHFPSTKVLDLDPECTAHFYNYATGFGYDSSQDDFKVVRIWIPNYPCDECHCKSLLPACDVYSARKGVWRVSVAENIKSYQLDSEQGCFVNGAIHWVVADHDFENYFVLMFDCESEELRAMELPQAAQGDHYDRRELFEYGGLLSLLASWEGHVELWGEGHVELWVMEEHGVSSSWQKLYEISDDTQLNWNVDVSQSSYQKLAPYGPNECIKFRWNRELFDDIFCNNVYEESMLLMNYTNSLSYAPEGVVTFDKCNKLFHP